MESRDIASINWMPPWEPVNEGGSFEAELCREVIDGHPLFGAPARAIGRRIDCDDVLFSVEQSTHSIAVVHLTWRMNPETDPAWPATRLFRDVEHWVRECMLPDNLQHIHDRAKTASQPDEVAPELAGEVIKQHASRTQISRILDAYTDPGERLAAANVLAGLPDLRWARRLRFLIVLLALFFALFSLLDIAAMLDEGVTPWWLISLIVNVALSVGLLLRQRWSFLAAPGWLLINATLSIKAVLANDLSDEQTSEYFIEITVLVGFCVLAFCLKRILFPYYGLRGPKLDAAGNLLILGKARNRK